MLIAGSLLATPAFAQGTAVITGTVVDAQNKNPLPDVVITATAPTLQGEQVVVTDATGTYRLPQLPSGTYTVRYEKEGFKTFSRGDINLRQDVTVRVNIEMLPSELKEDIVIVGKAPTVDVGSTTTGVSVSSEFIKNIAVVNPGARGGAARSFESLAVVAPGANSDLYGVSINGTTSPENQYVIDGLSVNDPGFGLNATPLTVEFVSEVNVLAGGYMPEYGRATGGVMSVVTKSGSNEFHGSVFGNMTPGALEGDRTFCGPGQTWGINCGLEVRRNGTTISTQDRLWNLGDFGAEIGGPILKDKLWFYAGLAPSMTRRQLERNLYALEWDPTVTGPIGSPADVNGGAYQRDPATGFIIANQIPGNTRAWFADLSTVQYIGKLTYLITQDHNLSVSILGAPSWSGGQNEFGIDPQDGGVEVANVSGPWAALAHNYAATSNDVSAKLASSFMEKRVLLDTTLGWHHQYYAVDPNDGTGIGTADGLAGLPAVAYRRNGRTVYDANGDRRTQSNYHTLADFETLNQQAQDACGEAKGVRGLVCPVTSYRTGGAGFIGHDNLDRYQGKMVGTFLANALGHHVIKAGVDLEYMSYDRLKAYSGGVYYRESTSGSYFADYRQYGFLTGPDTAYQQKAFTSASASFTYGGFVQDSWNVLDLVTVNAGVRYDTQNLYGNHRQDLDLNLGNQISPRVGVVYDFTQQGRSKLFANYARFYENAVLDMIDRQFPGERQYTGFRYRTAVSGGRPGCSPLTDTNWVTNCQDTRNLIATVNTYGTTPDDPNQYYIITGGDQSAVDPNLQPQSSDELVLGGEYEVFTDARAGVTYTRRYMNSVIEDMSRDEATTYFIGNPGQGIANDFPKASRNYDAVTLSLNKNFSDLWLAQASYTWSYLRGNYAGLFRPETGQLDPNINSDFDLVSLLPNRYGPLPGDRTHSFKLFGSKAFVLAGNMSLNLGLTYTLRSGSPLNVLGSHELYGGGEVYILKRGSGGRLPWVNNMDAHIGFSYKLAKDSEASLSVDLFNLFNWQQVTARDTVYTNDNVWPLVNVSDPKALEGLLNTGGDPVTVNPNYKNPTGYQAARSIRFGAKVTF